MAGCIFAYYIKTTWFYIRGYWSCRKYADIWAICKG